MSRSRRPASLKRLSVKSLAKKGAPRIDFEGLPAELAYNVFKEKLNQKTLEEDDIDRLMKPGLREIDVRSIDAMLATKLLKTIVATQRRLVRVKLWPSLSATCRKNLILQKEDFEALAPALETVRR